MPVHTQLPELYMHGLAQGNLELVLRGLLADEAPLCASSIAWLKAGWRVEHGIRRKARLKDQGTRLPAGGRG